MAAFHARVHLVLWVDKKDYCFGLRLFMIILVAESFNFLVHCLCTKAFRFCSFYVSNVISKPSLHSFFIFIYLSIIHKH